MNPSRRVIKLGDRGNYERTDPDYEDKRMAQICRDFDACPKEWRDTFLAGLTKKEIKEITKRRQARRTKKT